MADSSIAVPAATATATATAVASVKTFVVRDSLGNLVQVQGTANTDDSGRPLTAMTEETGRDIVRVLQSINNILCEYTGCGARIDA